MTRTQEDHDGELVVAMAKGDEDAFVAVYRRYLPLVLRWCLRETGNRELAADLSAEVFAAALDRGPPLPAGARLGGRVAAGDRAQQAGRKPPPGARSRNRPAGVCGWSRGR